MKSTKEQLLQIQEKLNDLIERDATQEDAIREVNEILKGIGYNIQPAKNFVAENERILNDWREKYIKENQSLYPNCPNLGDYFANDGIMFMGKIVAEPKVYPNGDRTFRWKREISGMENELWTKEPLRILYLNKRSKHRR